MRTSLFLMLCLLAIAMQAFAQEVQPTETNLSVTPAKDGAEMIQALKIATELADWARENNSALALATAAQIVKTIPQQEMQGLFPKVERGAGIGKGGESDAEPKTARFVTAEDLLNEAIAMCGDDKALADSCRKVVASGPEARGAEGGPVYHVDKVKAQTTDQYLIRMVGGELAAILVEGDGDTDLDLFVFDEYGNLIGQDTDATDRCYVEWTPKWTGPFLVCVKNLGTVYNRYILRTN